MSAVPAATSQEEVETSLMSSISAKIEPGEDLDELEEDLGEPLPPQTSGAIAVPNQDAGPAPPNLIQLAMRSMSSSNTLDSSPSPRVSNSASSVQDQGADTTADPAAIHTPFTTISPETLQALTKASVAAPPASNHDDGNATAPSIVPPPTIPRVERSGSPPPGSFSSAFPMLSPPLAPVKERVVEDIRALSDDDDEDVPTLENLLAGTRPDYNSQKKSQESPCRSPDSSPVRSERTVVKVKPESQGPTPFLRPETPPGRVVIDLSDSSPFQSPTPQKRPIPPPAESSASQARTKRKHTPSSVPPSGLGSPPAKRSKITLAAVPARKHDVHWALDGSIVIQIQDIKFKLHKSHLAKHSPWFSGLFDGANVTGGEYVERVDDDGSTPMYILSLPGLTAKDFTRLLDGFDNAIIYVHQDPSFPRIASILRVATLLSFPDFRDWAIRLLEDRWSPALADLSTECIAHATETVLLSRACDAPTFLKRAMYELVRLPGYGQTADRVGVAAPDFHALVLAREQLTALWVQTVSPYSQDFVDCASATPVPPAPPAEVECTTTNPLLSGKAHKKLMQESGIGDDYFHDPLCGLQALIDADWAGEGYCAPCVALRRKVWAGRREKIWENLDVWFGLD